MLTLMDPLQRHGRIKRPSSATFVPSKQIRHCFCSLSSGGSWSWLGIKLYRLSVIRQLDLHRVTPSRPDQQPRPTKLGMGEGAETQNSLRIVGLFAGIGSGMLYF